MSARKGRASIGTSGWNYAHWVGPFYPRGLPQKQWFEYYARQFAAVELNVTFYRLPAESVFQGWARRAPAHFRFVLKGSRLITHRKRLAGCRELIAEFFERAMPLQDKTVAILWQLPPGFALQPARLDGFLDALAAQPGARALRHAFEFRERSWFCDSTYRLLREHRAAIVAADMPFQVLLPGMRARPAELPVVRVPHTADWVYLRRHGPAGRYRDCYPSATVRADARHLRRLLDEGRDALLFYNNDAKGCAVKNARDLAHGVSGRTG